MDQLEADKPLQYLVFVLCDRAEEFHYFFKFKKYFEHQSKINFVLMSIDESLMKLFVGRKRQTAKWFAEKLKGIIP